MFTPGVDIWMHSGQGTGGSVALLRRFTSQTGADNQGRPVTAFRSSAYSDAYEFWRCISGSSGGNWATSLESSNFYAGVILAQPVVVHAVALCGRQDSKEEYPVRWRIEGSNNTTTGRDGTWAVLLDKSQADTSLHASRGVQTFSFNIPRQYRAARIWIVQGTGPNPGLSVFQLQARLA